LLGQLADSSFTNQATPLHRGFARYFLTLQGSFWWLQAWAFAVLNALNFVWSLEFVLPKNGQGFMQRKDA